MGKEEVERVVADWGKEEEEGVGREGAVGCKNKGCKWEEDVMSAQM